MAARDRGYAAVSGYSVAMSGVCSRGCECTGLLVDGTEVVVRPIRTSDSKALDDFHNRLSSNTVYMRFFHAHPRLRADELEHFTRVDYRTRMALVAELAGELAGVARYESRKGQATAEAAFVVADAVQGRGLGTLLLEHLAAAGRRRGISSFTAETLTTNERMQEVFRTAGFESRSRWSDGMVEVVFPIAPTDTYLRSVLSRHCTSVRARLVDRITHVGSGTVGSVCLSERSAEELLSASDEEGTRVSDLLIVGEAGEASAGLAAMAAGEVDAAVVELGDLPMPRRFVAVARELAKRVRVMAVDPRLRFGYICDQAGIYRSATWVGALAGLRGARCGRGSRGQVVDFEGCDVARARSLLDELEPSASARWPPFELTSESTIELLDAYGVQNPSAVRLSAGDHSGQLAVAAVMPGARSLIRMVPLTDRDAEDLAGGDGECAARLARLVDDQPDLRRVEVAPGSAHAWVGAPRCCADDPFVRMLSPRGRQGALGL